MKTLADLKRMMVVGSKWHGHHHLQNRDMGVKEVSKIQSKAVAFHTQMGDSWLEFPKAKSIAFHTDGKGFTILNDLCEPVLSYKLV